MCKVDGNPTDSRRISITTCKAEEKIIHQYPISKDPMPFLRAVVFIFNLLIFSGEGKLQFSSHI